MRPAVRGLRRAAVTLAGCALLGVTAAVPSGAAAPGGGAVPSGASAPATTGPARPTTAPAADPEATTPRPWGVPSRVRGQYPVARAEYDLGDQAFVPPQLARLRNNRVELRGDVHYPTDLRRGPFPLVVFMHGNHVSCFGADGTASFEWPCPRDRRPVPSYRGYDYAARVLASHGYIIVSASVNGVNVLGSELPDTGMLARAQVLQKHLDLWRAWAGGARGPFGARFRHAVDWRRVGTMGHSRGGEGVVVHALYNRAQPRPYAVRAVLPLAPVDFGREVLTGVPMAVVLPYCDGDVADLQGVRLYNDARYARRGDPAPRQTVLAYGANHNFFNTVWSPSSGIPGAFDDWGFTGAAHDTHCSVRYGQRLTEAQQRAVGASYITNYFRRYLGGDRRLDPIWTGLVGPARGVAPITVVVSYHAPDAARRDVNRLTDAANRTRNTLGGRVVGRGLTRVRFCGIDDLCVPGEPSGLDFPLHQPGVPGWRQLVLGWGNRGATWTNEVPYRARDVRRFDGLAFRAAVNYSHRDNPGGRRQQLDVVLVDRRGRQAAVAVRTAPALLYPPGGTTFTGEFSPAPHMLPTQVRVPLSAFRGVDLRNVRFVTLRFGRTPAGTLDVSDLSFTRSPTW